MKSYAFIFVALFATLLAGAQNIAVVSPSNTTTICQTLDEAISKAIGGSVIYLPGGGFQVSNETVIDKPLTIMGVSHRGDTENADGASIISGRLNFTGNSSGSAVIGVYVSGNIDVGEGGEEATGVENLTLRYCNVNSIQVHNNLSTGLVVNQCYLRTTSQFNNTNVKLSNSIVHSLKDINGGTINHNVVTSNYQHLRGYGATGWPLYDYYPFFNISSSTITNNIMLAWSNGHSGDNCYISNNCIGTGTWNSDGNPVVAPEMPEGTNVWNVLFGEGNNKGVSIFSDYKVKASWGKGKASDGTDIGIYGGTGFSDDALAPIPRIVSKKVAEQTDATGRLKIEVTVKAE